MTTNTSRFLSQFLEASERPEGTLSYHETRGFLFAVACAPNPVKPSEWLPIIFNDLDADYADMHEAQTVIQALIELYNQANSEVLLGNVGLPDDVTIITPALKNVGETSALGQWSRGFFLGHDWLIELWHQYTPKELDEELGSSLMVLSFFSGRELAEAYHGEVSPTSGKSLEEFAQNLLGMFEEAMNSYALLGRSIQKALAADAMPLELYVSEVTAGRNDPCPCGSGKKFKKCCLH